MLPPAAWPPKAIRTRRGRPATRIMKHQTTIMCPWCSAGARMTFTDGQGEYCMACKKDLVTGRPMKR